MVPDPPSGVQTRPNAREETLVVLTSGVTAINRVSHNENNGLLENKKIKKRIMINVYESKEQFIMFRCNQV